MQSQFFTSFLMISDWRTVLFLVVLAVIFFGIHVLYHKQHKSFSLVVVIGMVAGALLGLAMQAMAGSPADPTKTVFIKETTNWLQLFGGGYIDLIKMIVIPLVIVSIAHVVINLEKGKSMSRLVKRTLVVTLFMTAVSASIGLAFGVLFNVGGPRYGRSQSQDRDQRGIPPAGPDPRQSGAVHGEEQHYRHGDLCRLPGPGHLVDEGRRQGPGDLSAYPDRRFS